MDAPIYPPAAAFEPPVRVATPISVEAFSVDELMRNAPAWAIVLKHLPMMRAIVGAAQAKPHLGNTTLDSYRLYIPGLTAQTLAAIDAELAQLSPSL